MDPHEMSQEDQVAAADARKAAVSWTGGKDCNLAMLLAWRESSLRVEALVVFRPRDAVFRAHPLGIMEAQAAALSLPLLQVEISGEPSFKDSYVAGMRRLQEEHGIEVLVTGDMDLVGSMQRNWIEECGEECGMEAWLPLWKADRGECLRKLLHEGFKVVFSCVKSPHFDGSWIGRQLDEDAVREMMSKVPAGLDLGGEKGEYHTMVLAGPLHTQEVVLYTEDHVNRHIHGLACELFDQVGQKEGERWWVLQLATLNPKP